MVWSLAKKENRRRLAEDAARSRASGWARLAAVIAVVVYNIVGVADIYSTVVAIETGAGTEANPFLRVMMENAGEGWILAKLALQFVISFMVLWFPHWFVLSLFTLATAGNALVVYNNLLISGHFV